VAHRHPARSTAPEDKSCASCGRRIVWRAKWKDDWADVRYCSAACRRHGVTAQDRDLEARILTMLADRAGGASIDGAEVARAAAGSGSGDGGQEGEGLMEPVRRAARRLVDRGDVVITQDGRVVDPSTAKGPIRIRRA